MKDFINISFKGKSQYCETDMYQSIHLFVTDVYNGMGWVFKKKNYQIKLLTKNLKKLLILS